MRGAAKLHDIRHSDLDLSMHLLFNEGGPLRDLALCQVGDISAA